LHEQNVPLVDEWLQAHPGQPLPDYFVTAMSLTPEEHVRVQAAIQRWVDSSISKTCNVPNNYSVDDVRKLYEFMYDSGCKGGTIYRDGSRDEQVLMLKEEKKAEKVEQVSKVEKVETKKPAPAVAPLPMQRRGITISKHTPLGTVHTTSNHDENGEPFEVFTTIGKAGSDLQADAEAMGRLISLLLRIDSPVSRRERLGLIVSQLEGIGGARSVGFGINRVASMPDALAATLREMYFNENVQPVVVPSEPEATAVQTNGHTANGNGKHAIEPTRVKLPGADLCPECGMVTLVRSEGCKKCETCGYSEC
jgi:ribonucleoside-diphosphate reductase alpha chain